MKKKIIAAILIGTMLVTAAGCSNKETSDADKKAAEENDEGEAVDTEESAQHLCHKKQHIPVSLNVILRVNGKNLSSVWHRFNLCLCLCQFHVTGFAA